MFKYDCAYDEIPKFWMEHYQTGKGETVCGIYGVCINSSGADDEFEYVIADNYIPGADIPAGFITKDIAKHTWAVFPCNGALPNALQSVNTKVFSEWLPGNKEYEMAAAYSLEVYSDPCDFPNGNQDENYYSEIWVPVEEKTYEN